MYFSQRTLLFHYVKLTQIHTLLLCLGTTTIPAYQSMGTFSLRLTLIISVRFTLALLGLSEVEVFILLQSTPYVLNTFTIVSNEMWKYFALCVWTGYTK